MVGFRQQRPFLGHGRLAVQGRRVVEQGCNLPGGQALRHRDAADDRAAGDDVADHRAHAGSGFEAEFAGLQAAAPFGEADRGDKQHRIPDDPGGVQFRRDPTRSVAGLDDDGGGFRQRSRFVVAFPAQPACDRRAENGDHGEKQGQTQRRPHGPRPSSGV
jgi:hypothetical protein